MRPFIRRIRIVLALVAAALLAAPGDRLVAESPIASVQSDASGEWPQILGPRRNGLSTETGLLDRWPDQGPKVVWRAAGGVGMSCLAVSRGRVLTMVQREGKQWLVALNAQTGEPIGRPRSLRNIVTPWGMVPARRRPSPPIRCLCLPARESWRRSIFVTAS